jgi:hypothetical protein
VADGSQAALHRGAGYWEVTRIDQDGSLTDETQMVYAEEPRG